MHTHLAVHSHYSLLESPLKIPALVQRAKEAGWTALALTDHHSMAGCIEFGHECRQYGIKPVYGLEIDTTGAFAPGTLNLLAKSDAGYRNLLALASQPGPLSLTTLAAFSEGVIAISGQECGEIGQLVKDGKKEQAVAAFAQLQTVFTKVRLLLQVETQQRKEVANQLVALFPAEVLVAGQNVYCIDDDTALAAKVLRAIKQSQLLTDTAFDELPMLSVDEMNALFAKLPEAVVNAARLVNDCHVTLPKETKLPSPPSAPNLNEQVYQGAVQRYGEIPATVDERLAHELSMIEDMGFANYFLLVADIVRFAKSNRIPVGPGRGSAAASLVAYCLGITDIDPLVYDLIFERFLNRDRSGLPDIDLDFCHEQRSRVLDYVLKRYGASFVAQIGTYGTFGLRAAIRDGGKSLGLAKPRLDALCNQIHTTELTPEVTRTLQDDPELLRIVRVLLGVNRHFSVHAAGVLLSHQPIMHYTAITEDRGALPVTQAPMQALERAGLLKIDLLGLKTLTILANVEQQIQREDPNFHLSSIPLDDPATYALLQRGQTNGVFQLESKMFRDILGECKPDRFDDLVALLALGRPGPLAHVPEYARRKRGEHKPPSLHPFVETTLQETYGLMIYQEQVMAIAHRLGQLSLADADVLRIAMSKKNRALLRKLEEHFIVGCQDNGLTRKQASQLFAEMEQFADYAFNKAHSCCYALITYQTAFVKAHYPARFMASVLSNLSDQERIGEYLADCHLPVLPPDVRFSECDFSVEGPHLRIGLANLKHASRPVASTIVAERKQPFTDLADFLRRVQPPKRTVESLAYAGALDGFGPRMDVLHTLWETYDDPRKRPTPRELLELEKDIVGLYLSDHPTSRWQPFLQRVARSFPGYLSGEIRSVGFRQRELVGELATAQGGATFVLKQPMFRPFLTPSALVALFGPVQGATCEVSWVLPLSEILWVSPRQEQFAALQETLRQHQGQRAVVLALAPHRILLLPPDLWVNIAEPLCHRLEAEQIGFKIVDPWDR